jgi:hypothetical protein
MVHHAIVNDEFVNLIELLYVRLCLLPTGNHQSVWRVDHPKTASIGECD